MFDLITKSSIRRKIVLLLVYNQEKEFYLSEIAKSVRTSAGTAKRELNRLLDADLILFRKRGHLNMYRLNVRYSFLAEIVTIVRKTIGVEVELARELAKIEGISFAFLFGSYAKGNLRSGSDIDLYIVGSADEDEIYRAVKSVEDEVGREINYHIADTEEFVRKAKEGTFVANITSEPLMLLGTEDDLKKLIG